MQCLIDNHINIATPFLYRQCSTVTGGRYISDLNNVLAASGMKVSKQSLYYNIGCLNTLTKIHEGTHGIWSLEWEEIKTVHRGSGG